MRIRGIILIIFLMIYYRGDAFAAPDTVSIYFPFNQNSLSEEARDTLDAAIYRGAISETVPLQIIGYTDEVGSNNYNLQLSRERAASVKSYLISSGFKARLITLVIGRGETGAKQATGPDGNAADRRVDLVVGPPVKTTKPGKVVQVKFVSGGPKKLSTTDISSVAVGETMVLDNIYFIAGRHVTRPESDESMDALYNALEANPSIHVSIEGHVCCVSASAMDAIDDDTHRMELSINRAKAIRDYLVKRGIDPGRLEFAGFGHRKPVVMPETTEEEADRNRRVEIRIIKN